MSWRGSKSPTTFFELPEFEFSHSPNAKRKDRPIFLGRKEEQKRLKMLLGDSKSGSGTYLVTGYRGSGKTSFVNRVIHELQSFDNTTWSGLYILLMAIFSEFILSWGLNLFFKASDLISAPLLLTFISIFISLPLINGDYRYLMTRVRDLLKSRLVWLIGGGYFVFCVLTAFAFIIPNWFQNYIIGIWGALSILSLLFLATLGNIISQVRKRRFFKREQLNILIPLQKKIAIVASFFFFSFSNLLVLLMRYDYHVYGSLETWSDWFYFILVWILIIICTGIFTLTVFYSAETARPYSVFRFYQSSRYHASRLITFVYFFIVIVFLRFSYQYWLPTFNPIIHRIKFYDKGLGELLSDGVFRADLSQLLLVMTFVFLVFPLVPFCNTVAALYLSTPRKRWFTNGCVLIIPSLFFLVGYLSIRWSHSDSSSSQATTQYTENIVNFFDFNVSVTLYSIVILIFLARAFYQWVRKGRSVPSKNRSAPFSRPNKKKTSRSDLGIWIQKIIRSKHFQDEIPEGTTGLLSKTVLITLVMGYIAISFVHAGFLLLLPAFILLGFRSMLTSNTLSR